MIRRYFRLFFLLMKHGFASDVASPLDFWTFLAGKLVRMFFFLVFIYSIFRVTPHLAGYNLPQVLLVFATFNIVDVVTQLLFFRGFFYLQEIVRNGHFDTVLTYPVSPLFFSAFRKLDYMDFFTLIPIGGIVVWAALHLATPIAVFHVLLYFFLLLNSLIITFAICTYIAACTFFTHDLEYAWFLYRFGIQAGRYPIEIFREPFRFVFTWVIPLGVIVTFPTRAFLGILSLPFIIASFVFGGLFLYTALWFWRYALRHYSSASS